MRIQLESADQLGELVRATRKHQSLRQDLLAEMLGVSENFMGRLENGAVTMQWDKLFLVLNSLGIYVIVDLPDGVEEELARREKKNQTRLKALAANDSPDSKRAVANSPGMPKDLTLTHRHSGG